MENDVLNVGNSLGSKECLVIGFVCVYHFMD